ncbi:MAG: hypothetical protein K2Z81_10780, partial [Cyanobacteria bacterium]|nr:hypothetical protein [Cyanobacteriota bacterium]
SYITGEGFKDLQDADVSLLQIGNCPISDNGLATIARMKKLTTIYMCELAFVTNSGIAALAKSPIECLVFSGAKLGEDCLKALDENRSLKILQIEKMKISATGVSCIQTIPTITSLNFVNCQLSPDAYSELIKGREFNHLSFGGKQRAAIGEKEMAAILRFPSQIIELYETQVTREALVRLAEGDAHKLGKLQIWCTEITDEEISRYQKQFPHSEFHRGKIVDKPYHSPLKDFANSYPEW